MRILLAALMIVIPAAAQHPLVRLVNANHSASSAFQVGDRFEVLVTGAPNQPVSVRTTMDGRTDWARSLARLIALEDGLRQGNSGRATSGVGMRFGPSEAGSRAPQFSSRSAHLVCQADGVWRSSAAKT